MANSNLYLVHGATGNLGSLIVDDLLKRGLPAANIVGGVRDGASDKAKKLTAKGIALRVADYNKKDDLVKVYQGIHTVVYVPTPSSQLERATSAHNSIEAAKTAGVKRYVQLSWGNGRSDSHDWITPAYAFAEGVLRQSGLTWLILRMGVWWDNHLDAYKGALASGVISRISKPETRGAWITRLDTARSTAAAVLKGDLNHRVFDVHSNVALSNVEVAQALSELTKKTITFKELSLEQLTEILKGRLGPAAGYVAGLVAAIDVAIAAGEYPISNAYFELTGTTPETLREFLKREVLNTA